MAVEISSAAGFEAAIPVPLFETKVAMVMLTGFRNHFVPEPNGQKFLVVRIMQNQEPAPITIVTNWRAGLPH